MNAELWSAVWAPALALLAVGLPLLMYVGTRMKDRQREHADERTRAIEALALAGDLVAKAESIAATSEAGTLLVGENAQLAGQSLGSARQRVAEGEFSKFSSEAAALAEAPRRLLANPASLKNCSDAELADHLVRLRVAQARMDGLRSRANEYLAACRRDNDNLRQPPR